MSNPIQVNRVQILTIVGAGGHARTLRDEIAPRTPFGTPLAELLEIGVPFPAAKTRAWVIGVGDNRLRAKLAAQVDAFFKAFHANFGDAFNQGWVQLVARSEQLDLGTVVLNGAVIGCNTKIGKHCILNHACVVEHDVTLGDFVHVAPGAKMLGGSKAGEGTLIGANAVVLPNATVPDWRVVRACSVFPSDYAPPFGKKPDGLPLPTLEHVNE